ncbi:lytic polysaccharide monooxygenase, partial [Cadophora sp. DSE1049]
LFLLSSASCHLFVGNPPPLRWHQDITLLIMPLNGDPNAFPPIGQQPFPCKGFHADIDGPGGDPVASWTAGQDVTFSYVLQSAHSGGSCQVALSYDKGKTWVVVQTWEGNCPRAQTPGTVTNIYDVDQNYTFSIPEDFPTGHRVIFAWVWINATGNREYYMSCSSVNISGSGPVPTITPAGPPLLVANLDPMKQECYTKEGTSVIYP